MSVDLMCEILRYFYLMDEHELYRLHCDLFCAKEFNLTAFLNGFHRFTVTDNMITFEDERCNLLNTLYDLCSLVVRNRNIDVLPF